MANASLSQRLEWKVLPTVTTSDHFPIITQYIPRMNDKNNNTCERWNLKNANWLLYTELLEIEIENIKDKSLIDTDNLVQLLTEAIIKITNIFIEKTN